MNDLDKIENLKNQIKHFKQYEGYTDSQLTEVVKERIKAKESKIDIDKAFTDKKEKKLAKSLLDKYLHDYIVETIAHRNQLEQLLYLEVLQSRFQFDANKFHKESKAIPTALVNSIHQNLEVIMKIKESLGFMAKDAPKGFDAIETLKRKHKIWLDDNQLHRTMVCPHCGKICLLKMKTDKYDCQKHPFFKDRVLYNKHLIKLYKENRLDETDISKILECSPDYVDWLLKYEDKNEQKNIQPKQPEQLEST